ncbi:MAG: SgcJ/EcaC family oxidoreductase [Verrucomicrobiia bacterium]
MQIQRVQLQQKLLVLVAVLWTSVLAGCATQSAQSALPGTNIPEEVAFECRRLVEAWNVGDFAGFISVYAETATFTLADGFLVGRQAIRDFYSPNFQPGAVRDELTFEQMDIEVLAPDAALARVLYRNSRNGEVVRRGTVSLVMRRIYGQWQIIHDHSS